MSFLLGFLPKGGADARFQGIGLPGFQWLGRDARDCGAFWCFGELTQSARLELTPERLVVLVGRIRLDRREKLLASLEGHLPVLGKMAGDADLVLCAFARWGEDMINRIHGDFAFVIWDSGTRKLYCARDRLGIRPLAYFERSSCWWISDSMELLSRAPGYSDGDPDAVWISHFLRHGAGEPSRAAYAHVHRLLPAHTLTLSREAATERRYWSFEIGSPLHLSSQSAYLEQFDALLASAIRDRMPEGKVGISMSGGIDSPALAAMAVEVAATPDRVVARTTVLRGERDPEWAPSRLVARHLGISQELVDVEPLLYDPAWQEKVANFPEPTVEVTYPAAWKYQRQAMRAMSSIWFLGEGPDNALTFEWQPYLAWLVRHHRWADLSLAALRYIGSKSFAEWKLTARYLLQSGKLPEERSAPWMPALPSECSREIALEPKGAPSWRPQADRSWRALHLWTNLFEGLDSMHTAYDLEWRHPYLDLELLEFMLRTPPIPWARRKQLLRQAMKGRLPDAIVANPKFVGRTDIIAEAIRAAPPKLPGKGSPVEAFVSLEKVPEDPFRLGDPHELLRLAIVDHWLRGKISEYG